jgi:cardiolipin synthase
VLFERQSGSIGEEASLPLTRFHGMSPEARRPSQHRPLEGPQPEYAYLCPPGETIIPGNSAELLCDGEEALPVMLAAIQNARRSVEVEMYCFASDFVGSRFARALAERSQHGVRVRVMVDSAGCRHTPRSFFGWMRERGVRVQGINPLHKFLRHGALFRWRDHRKLVVIDGGVAFVGGLNLSRDYAPAIEGGSGWRDTSIRLVGPIVSTLCASFEKLWKDVARAEPAWTVVPEPLPRAGEIPAMVLESRPVGPGKFAAVFRHAVNQSRRRVWIGNPYFLPPRSFRRALRRAAHRGVDVRILVPGRCDSSFVLRASQRSYSYFLRSGIRIFEWPGTMMHSKTAVVDGLWSTIGSYNIDPLSLLVNRELNVVLLGRSAGSRFEAMFEEDFSRSVEVDSMKWKCRGPLRRIEETLCASFRIFL